MLRKRTNTLQSPDEDSESQWKAKAKSSVTNNVMNGHRGHGNGHSRGGKDSRLPSFPSVTDRFSDAESSEDDADADVDPAADDNDKVDSEHDEEDVHNTNSDDSRRTSSSRARSTSSVASSRTARPKFTQAEVVEAADHAAKSRRRAWYELDASIALALGAPALNWFTGGDLVQNILLLLLLVFYLHQLIEGIFTSLYA